MRFPLVLAVLALLAPICGGPAHADGDAALKALLTGDDSRGWDAVGRLDLGKKGFCTGALITPSLVLTAAHCLFDKTSGAKVAPGDITFLAGLRNGRAAAYRSVKRAIAHPEYVFGGHERLGRVAYDLALVELDQPIRLPSIVPFATEGQPRTGDAVGVVSYAQDRAEAPSLQEVCHVLERQTGVLVLSCSVDFGSSGAPIFAIQDGVARIVSVVSAKAEYEGRKVALGTTLDAPLSELMDELARDVGFRRPGSALRDGAGASAKFVKP